MFIKAKHPHLQTRISLLLKNDETFDLTLKIVVRVVLTLLQRGLRPKTDLSQPSHTRWVHLPPSRFF